MESQLGVSEGVQNLLHSGYSNMSFDFHSMNAKLTHIMRAISDNGYAAATVRAQAMALREYCFR